MKYIKQLTKLVFITLIFFVLSINLSGCCGHSGGGSSGGSSVSKEIIGEKKVNDDGSVYFSGEGITLSALPDTFSKGTSIRFSKVTGGDMLSCLGMSGKPIVLSSEVYGVEISPEQEILNNAATVTIDLSPNYDSTKKQYFALNRETPVLVTSENTSMSLSSRAAKKKSIELGFVTTFSYIAAASLKNEILSKDPYIWCDNSSKEVIKDKYSSDVTIFAQLSTKEDIDKIFNGSVSFNVAIRTDDKKLNALSHKSSPIAARASKTKSSLTYGAIDLTKVHSVKIDKNTFQYDAFFNALNKSFQDIPRRVVVESVFTSTDNIPLASQEYVIFFRSPKRPYVLSTYPADQDCLTNVAQLDNVVVNFSESMNTSSVEEALTISTNNQTYSKSKGNLTFNWSENNKKLAITSNFAFPNATGTYNIKIAKSALSASNANIAKTAFALNAEDVEWSFNYNKNDFYVIMTSPKPGDTNVAIKNANNNMKGPDITLSFNETFNPSSLNSAVTLKTKNGDIIKFSGNTYMDEKTYIITPTKALNYNQEYIVEVSATVQNFSVNNNKPKTLGEIYKASFKTKEPFASGSGTKDDPYMITTQEELDNIRLNGYINTDKCYKLANDITYEKPQTLGTSNKAYWEPIGNDKTPFTGYFEGNNKTITDLDINQNDPYAGLFGKVVNSTISNLNLDNPDIDGHEFVGSLAGYMVYSNVSNVKVTGINIGATSERAGGLIGTANSTQINNCSVEASIDLSFGTTDYCGGLVGVLTANSTLSNSYVKLLNKVELVGSDQIGGLVGYSEASKIQESNFSGVIKASSKEVGGIVGKASNSTISKCSSLEGSASGSMDIGGVCGNLIDNSLIEECSSSIDVTGAANNVGGLVGNSNNSSIINSFITDKAVKSSADCCGGLVGYIKDSSIESCYSRASVSGKDSVGGLAGLSEGSTTFSKSAALNTELAGTNKDNLNKVLGKGSHTITQCYSLSNMTISFVGAKADSDSYQHKHNELDGEEKDSVSAIVSNLLLDTSIWNTGSTYPVHK
ncbi:MAG: Ig-like domain-containing protein [Candidatus Riflebacteria bacterium]|nr:Ig-like domain-containing protein [Candidatus Riflebacteria bacterium]